MPLFFHFFKSYPHFFNISVYLCKTLLIEILGSPIRTISMQSKKVSPDSRDFDIDDYIGMESCVDLRESHTAADMSPPSSITEENCKRDKKIWRMGNKDQNGYLPAIQLLVRTENLASHMPWVLKRHYTDDGRLILTEERLRHYEFFRAHRTDGRLMLKLVAFDDQLSDESNVEKGDEDGGGGEECGAAEGGENNGGRMVGVGGGSVTSMRT